MSKEVILFTKIGEDAVLDSIPLVDVKSVQQINQTQQAEATAPSSASSSSKVKAGDDLSNDILFEYRRIA
jgi:hypothetical protein